MTTINELVIATARDLNDYTDHVPNKQFQRWTIEQLLRYWNEALCVIYTLSPSRFRKSKVSKLGPGINHTFDDCDRVVSVVGVSDKDGYLLYEIDLDREDKALKWGGFRPVRCPEFTHTKDFKLTHYKIASDKDGSLFVKPPVPYGAEVYLKYMCETAPTQLTINDLDSDVSCTGCDDITLGVHWVLFRALMVDEESQTSTSLASQHLQLFLTMIGERSELDKEALYQLDTIPQSLKGFIAREIARYHVGVKSS